MIIDPEDGERKENNILNTSIGGGLMSKTEIELMKEKILPWPRRGDRPNDERNTSFFLSKSFPTLFPCSSGDITFKGRAKDVSWNDAIKHYIKYLDIVSNRYPFAEHARFLHYVQNMDENARINQQASVYIDRNKIDRNMTKEDLIKIISGTNAEKFSIEARMSR